MSTVRSGLPCKAGFGIPPNKFSLNTKTKMRGVIISTKDAGGERRLSKSLPTWQRVLDDVQVMEATLGKDLDVHTDERVGLPAVMRILAQNRWNVFGLDGAHVVSHVNQVACALSHMRAWKQAADSGHGLVVVEDDTSMLGSREDLERAVSDKDAVFVSLYAACKPKAKTVLELGDAFWGFQAYWISPEGARLLLKDCLPISRHVDMYLPAYVLKHKDDRFKIAHPRLKCHEDGSSLLNHTGGTKMWLIVLVSVVFLLILVVLLLYVKWYRDCTIKNKVQYEK